MNKKIMKDYIYTGLGFPIELHNVEMIKFEGDFHPKIDVKKIAQIAIKSLVLQKTRLTGAQVRFIRSYFCMSLREFSQVVNETHAAVKKWEDFADKQTNMDLNIEVMLRLYIFDRVIAKTEKKKVAFYKCYLQLTKIFFKHEPTSNLKSFSGPII